MDAGLPKRISVVNCAVNGLRRNFFTGCVAVVIAASLPAAQVWGQTSSSSSMVGLWYSQFMLSPRVSSALTIDGRKPEWRALTSSFKGEINVPVKLENDAIAFTLPDSVGEFRGRLVNSKTIAGHWIQPANEINNNRYATPVELKQAGRKVWRGEIAPLQARLSFYISIQQEPDGSATAIIRNPEANLFHRNRYHVDLREKALIFSDAKNPDAKFEGTFLNGERPLVSIQLPSFNIPIPFTKVKAEQAVGFIPQMDRDDPYIYLKPVEDDDGWRTASLKDVGLNVKPISELIRKILHVDPADNPLNIQSLLIARYGKLVLEEYFYGFDEDRLHDMRSASKTFAPFLVGVARDCGAKIDIDASAYAQFPEYKEFANSDPHKKEITVRDLMTMTSGLACDDNDENSPGNEDIMQQQTAQPDWYKYTLDLPMARDPGGDQAVYCSAGINLLGGIVRNATHTWLPDFFYENVAKPLQIKTYHWNLMPSGDGYAGGGLYLRPRDQLKLGQLYLNGGVWNGKRVVSKDWVGKSISRQSTFGKTLGADHDYGYGWHLYHFEVGDHRYRAYAAGGNGGQIVMVIPDLDLVVGFTGGAYGEFAKWYKWQTELVPQFIIPAATSTTPR
jgi:CubicO group peptidase (beta-lactamase class C family)